jgi:hypothetical protein
MRALYSAGITRLRANAAPRRACARAIAPRRQRRRAYRASASYRERSNGVMARKKAK